MIIDLLENSTVVEDLHPDFRMVFDYVKKQDLSVLAPGKIVLDGDRVYIQVAEVEGKEKTAARLETHNEYIDIQFPLEGEETFAWKGRAGLSEPEAAYNMRDDITFYGDTPEFYFTLNKGKFAVFFPGDAHAPCIGRGRIRKAIAKVRIN